MTYEEHIKQMQSSLTALVHELMQHEQFEAAHHFSAAARMLDEGHCVLHEEGVAEEEFIAGSQVRS